MKKKELRTALTSSLKKEEESVQDRFEKAEIALKSKSTIENNDSIEKGEKPSKIKKKTIRDSFTIPEDDHKMIKSLQERLLKLGQVTNKSEVVRAGFYALNSLSDEELLQIINQLEKIKTGRPLA